MKKILATLVCFIAIAQFSFAQISSKEYKLSNGSPYEVIDSHHKLYTTNGKYAVSAKQQKGSMSIQIYDMEKRKEIVRNEYPLAKYAYIEKLTSIQDKVYLFYTTWDKKNKIEQLLVRKVNIEKGTLDAPKKILTHKGGRVAGGFAMTGFRSYSLTSRFIFNQSFDKSKLYIHYREKPKKRDDHKNHDVLGVLVYDNNLKEIWTGKIEMPLSEAQMNNVDFAIGSDGTTYMLAEVYDSDVPKKYIKKQKNYHLELFTFKEGKVSRKEIKGDNYFIKTACISESPDNQLYLTGYYQAKPGFQSDVDGVFLIKLDTKGNTLSSTHHPIPLKVLNMYEKQGKQNKNERKEGKGKLDFEDLYLDEVLYQEDGSVILVGEQFFTTTVTTYSSSGRAYTRTYYHYNDILATKINANGELAWMKKLPKRQKTARTSMSLLGNFFQHKGAALGGMSYKYIAKNNNHYFFFLDNLKNIDLDINNPKKRPKYHIDGAGGIFTAYKLDDKTGEITKTSVLDVREVPMQGSKKPKEVYQFAINRVMETDKGLIIEVYKKKKEDIVLHLDF